MTSRLRVAVVENNSDTRRILADYLEDEGFEVVQGKRPEEVAGEIGNCAAAIIDVKIDADDIPPEDARFYGIRYVLRAKEDGTWNSAAKLIFISNFGFDRPTIQSLLVKIGEHATVDKPLEMMKLRRLRHLLRGEAAK